MLGCAQRSCHRPSNCGVAWAVLEATTCMSRDVEVFQIISVLPEADECAIPLRVRRRRSEMVECGRRCLEDTMTAKETHEWMGPSASSPPIALEHVVLPEALDPRLVV